MSDRVRDLAAAEDRHASLLACLIVPLAAAVVVCLAMPAFAGVLDPEAVARPDAKMVVTASAQAAPDDSTAAEEHHTLLARIDLSDQTMSVYENDTLVHVFTVSTGRRGYRTPVGEYQAEWLASKWRSRKYHNAPMPWSVFFYRGYAIHGTTEVRRLGRPASHGCVRLHPDNAKIFFGMVMDVGRKNTVITVVN